MNKRPHKGNVFQQPGGARPVNITFGPAGWPARFWRNK